jgi:hypothetical protein
LNGATSFASGLESHKEQFIAGSRLTKKVTLMAWFQSMRRKGGKNNLILSPSKRLNWQENIICNRMKNLKPHMKNWINYAQ